MNTRVKSVKCPTCGKQVLWDESSHWRPFCSERCRLIDLGEWAKESHRIADSTPPDFTELGEDENTQH